LRCLISLDDTDSRVGQCTTHLGFKVVSKLLSENCVFNHYPRLVRLNPNIPFKTRGNAAVCIEFDSDQPRESFETATDLLEKLSDVANGANSGAVFLEGDPDPAIFRPLYEAALSGLVSPRKVAKVLKDRGIRTSTLGNGMGLVGAAASMGFGESDDHTYELIAYREPDACGTPRLVDPDSVKQAERELFPRVFNSYDYGSRRVLVAPHGPDPVFCGVRADSPAIAIAAFRMLRYEERLAGYMVYASNQCTDAHLSSRLRVPLVAFSSGWLEGSVASLREGEGGHLFISLDVGGSTVQSVVYEPSGDLIGMAKKLLPGDLVCVFGGIRRGTSNHPPTLNVEKIQVLRAEPEVKYANPSCDACGKATKSEGDGKGFQCRACGSRPKARSKRATKLPRSITPGVYLPSPGAQRHLTKQLTRYGRELYAPYPLVEDWIESESFRPLRVPAQSRQ
jgi:tRNA(Ile2)-agmatinylcytidine synthase